MAFDVPTERCTVIKNGVVNIKPSNLNYKKGDPIKLIFHPTPWRGLNVILAAMQFIKNPLITLDVYSNTKDAFSPRAEPVVRCETMEDGAQPLSLNDCFDMINKWAWITNNNNSYSYPFLLVLNFHFEYNENIYLKIYDSIINKFSKYLVDKKYSFSGRNGLSKISLAPMVDCIGKIIIITNSYPSKTILDEINNASHSDPHLEDDGA